MKAAEFYRLLGEQIRRLRKAKGETQTALALKLKEKPNTISRWEAGIYHPSVHDLDRLAAHFYVAPESFLPTRNGYERIATMRQDALRDIVGSAQAGSCKLGCPVIGYYP